MKILVPGVDDLMEFMLKKQSARILPKALAKTLFGTFNIVGKAVKLSDFGECIRTCKQYAGACPL